MLICFNHNFAPWFYYVFFTSPFYIEIHCICYIVIVLIWYCFSFFAGNWRATSTTICIIHWRLIPRVGSLHTQLTILQPMERTLRTHTFYESSIHIKWTRNLLFCICPSVPILWSAHCVESPMNSVLCIGQPPPAAAPKSWHFVSEKTPEALTTGTDKWRRCGPHSGITFPLPFLLSMMMMRVEYVTICFRFSFATR